MTKLEDQRSTFTGFFDSAYFDSTFSSGPESQVLSETFEDCRKVDGFRKMEIVSSHGNSMYYRPGEMVYGGESRQIQLTLESEGDPSTAHLASIYVAGDNYYLSLDSSGGRIRDTRLIYDDEGIAPNRADILYYKNVLEQLRVGSNE